MKTNNERLKALRDRRAALGLKRREVYCHDDDYKALKSFVKALNDKKRVNNE
jgi:hypothetical protein